MKLSIITINYNNSKGLLKTINSILNQTYTEFEYIVIDGGSNDGSLEHIERNASKITYWVSEPDKGIYNAMNKGILASRGEYLLFLNSGDVLYDSKVIESVVDRLCDDDFIIGKMEFENTKEVNTLPHELSLLRFIEKSIPHPSTFIKRSVMLKYMYDEKFKIVSDCKFFMQALIFDNSSYKYLDTVVVLFETSGVSSTNVHLVEIEREMVLREIVPDRIRLDYLRFLNGKEYSGDLYDRFFAKVKKYSIGRIIYTFSVLVVRLLSLFKKNLRYVKAYPLFIKL